MAVEKFEIEDNKSWLANIGRRRDEGIAPWLPQDKTKYTGSFELPTFEYFNKEVDCKQNDTDIELPFEIKESIKASEQLLNLNDDWDGEGSAGYLASTLNRAVTFLTDNAVKYWKNSFVWVSTPEICPGPDGSIDLLWKLADRELLINIPVDENQPATYYGDDSKNNNITKGKLNLTEKHEWILMWLMK